MLRFGIMCDGNELIEPLARAVNRVLTVPDVELALVIVDQTPAPKHKRTFKKVLWAAYQRFFPVTHRKIDMTRTFARAGRLSCTVERKGFSEYFSSADVAAIRGYELDFILRFAFGIVRGDILQTARYGVWSYHHGDELKYRGGPPAFWEIYDGEPVTAAVLQRLTDKLDAGIVLQKCFIKTRHSHSENLHRILSASACMPARVCRDILNGHGDYVDGLPSSTDAPIHKAPGNFQMLAYFLKSRLRVERKSGFAHEPIVFEHEGERYWAPDSSQSRTVTLYRYVRERWQPDRVLIQDFAAVDPSLLHYDGQWWLFCTNADEGPNTALYIWHAPELAGPWTQHAQNPVKMDVRSSRSAGAFYIRNGIWYRPVQDRSVKGGKVRTCQLITLTPTLFLEEEVT